jgi:hypothetical protein
MNRVIHDMEGQVVRGDSMRNLKFKDGDTSLKKFDIVVANPMWNQPFGPDVLRTLPSRALRMAKVSTHREAAMRQAFSSHQSFGGWESPCDVMCSLI